MLNNDKLDYRDPEWVAEQLGIDKNTVYKYLQDGTLPALQLGRKWLISEGQLAKWLAEEARVQSQARREAAESAGRTGQRMDEFEPDAREAIVQAHAEARRYGHGYLGQEHLLLAVAAGGGCAGAEALAALGVDLSAVRSEFESRISPGTGQAPRRLKRTPRAKKAMRLARREARQAGCDRAGSDHLVLGILEAGEGAGYDILTSLGISAEAFRRQIRRPTGEE